jgi:hypothetical protein
MASMTAEERSQSLSPRAAWSTCDLSRTILDGARYDQQTRWPDGFDPVAAGAKLE